jgi:glycosyltransferase involved in cell wall biosynthesis
VRIAWVSYLDAHQYGGGGELEARYLLAVGRARGHQITESAFLRSRAQRAVRRSRLYRRLSVDWGADLFLLSNIRNAPQLRLPFPQAVLGRVLATGRVAILEDAAVDVCSFDLLPCLGDAARCAPACDKLWARSVFAAARIAVFRSPMHQRMINSVLGSAVPPVQILCPPNIDVGLFKPLGLTRDIPVLYVGSISAPKGYYNLIQRFGRDGVTFVGRNELSAPVAGNHLGELPHRELPPLYNRARVVAHLPVQHESMGRTVVEGALCGCEIVTNDRVGVTSYPRELWTDPATVAGNADRFWEQLEAAVTWAG